MLSQPNYQVACPLTLLTPRSLLLTHPHCTAVSFLKCLNLFPRLLSLGTQPPHLLWLNFPPSHSTPATSTNTRAQMLSFLLCLSFGFCFYVHGMPFPLPLPPGRGRYREGARARTGDGCADTQVDEHRT